MLVVYGCFHIAEKSSAFTTYQISHLKYITTQQEVSLTNQLLFSGLSGIIP